LKSTLVVACGNVLREDDAAGPWLAEHLDELAIPGVDILIVHQLQVELVEVFKDYDQIIVVDASFTGSGVEWNRVEAPQDPPNFATHHSSPQKLQSVFNQCYNRDLDLYVLTSRGESFGYREGFSPEMTQNLLEAYFFLVGFLLGRT